MYELLRGVIVGSIFMLLFVYYSYWFAIQCFFGGGGCNYVPGLRGVAFIAMYVVSYLGGGLLIRYAEGAAYLAIVQVIIAWNV